MHFVCSAGSLHHSHLLICHFICADEHPECAHWSSFAGGLIDFVLNGVMPNRTPWYLVFLAGAGYAAIYYTVFRVLIRKLNLKTPGREDEEIAVATTLTREERPYQIIEAVGGFDNIEDVDACATRLRLALVDDKKVNEKRLKELGLRV